MTHCNAGGVNFIGGTAAVNNGLMSEWHEQPDSSIQHKLFRVCSWDIATVIDQVRQQWVEH